MSNLKALELWLSVEIREALVVLPELPEPRVEAVEDLGNQWLVLTEAQTKLLKRNEFFAQKFWITQNLLCRGILNQRKSENLIARHAFRFLFSGIILVLVIP